MPTKILMVCLGNICRSPLAEGILASKLPKEDFLVDSAGTGNWHVGNPPDKRSIQVAKNHHVAIHQQKARQFKVSDFDTFDHIFVMDLQNYQDVLKLAPTISHAEKVKLLLDVLFPNEKVEVPDPYYGSERDFEQVYQLLNNACTVLAEQLMQS
ncbi:MAG: low molecular weight protein-tyrosine-phosphatase [Flavobacterium sp.]